MYEDQPSIWHAFISAAQTTPTQEADMNGRWRSMLTQGGEQNGHREHDDHVEKGGDERGEHVEGHEREGDRKLRDDVREQVKTHHKGFRPSSFVASAARRKSKSRQETISRTNQGGGEATDRGHCARGRGGVSKLEGALGGKERETLRALYPVEVCNPLSAARSADDMPPASIETASLKWNRQGVACVTRQLKASQGESTDETGRRCLTLGR